MLPSWRRAFDIPLRVLAITVCLSACGGGGAPAPRVGINTAGGWSDSPFMSGREPGAWPAG